MQPTEVGVNPGKLGQFFLAEFDRDLANEIADRIRSRRRFYLRYMVHVIPRRCCGFGKSEPRPIPTNGSIACASACGNPGSITPTWPRRRFRSPGMPAPERKIHCAR